MPHAPQSRTLRDHFSLQQRVKETDLGLFNAMDWEPVTPGPGSFAQSVLLQYSRRPLLVIAASDPDERLAAEFAERGRLRGQLELLNVVGAHRLVVCVNRIDEVDGTRQQERFEQIQRMVLGCLGDIGMPCEVEAPPKPGWDSSRSRSPSPARSQKESKGDSKAASAGKGKQQAVITARHPMVVVFVPTSARLLLTINDKAGDGAEAPKKGTEAAKQLGRLAWYQGRSLVAELKALCDPSAETALATRKALRLSIDDSYRIGGLGTVMAGRMVTGTLATGMQLAFAPDGPLVPCKSLEMHHEPVSATPGDNCGVFVGSRPTKEFFGRGQLAGLSDSGGDPPTRVWACEVAVQMRPRTRVEPGAVVSFLVHTAMKRAVVRRVLLRRCPRTGRLLEHLPPCARGNEFVVLELVPLAPMSCEPCCEFPDAARVVLRQDRRTVAIGLVASVVRVVGKLPPQPVKDWTTVDGKSNEHQRLTHAGMSRVAMEAAVAAARVAMKLAPGASRVASAEVTDPLATPAGALAAARFVLSQMPKNAVRRGCRSAFAAGGSKGARMVADVLSGGPAAAVEDNKGDAKSSAAAASTGQPLLPPALVRLVVAYYFDADGMNLDE